MIYLVVLFVALGLGVRFIRLPGPAELLELSPYAYTPGYLGPPPEEEESARLHRELLEAFDAEMGGYPLLLENGTLIKNTPRKPAVLGEARLSLPAYTPLESAGLRTGIRQVACADYATHDFGMTDRQRFDQTYLDMRNQMAGIGAAGMQNALMRNQLADRQWQ